MSKILPFIAFIRDCGMEKVERIKGGGCVYIDGNSDGRNLLGKVAFGELFALDRKDNERG